MTSLVGKYKDTIMKDDYEHWIKSGLFEGFEKYVAQQYERTSFDPKIRQAWIQEIITAYKRKRGEPRQAMPQQTGAEASPATSSKELIRRMPLGFNSSAAENMEAVYQFEIEGDEGFISHLSISRGECTYHDGPCDHPSVIIKSPSDVWLAISKGTIDGQFAFLSGKFLAEGDLGLLLKLKSVFSAK
jgi:putative sterol carrier protein